MKITFEAVGVVSTEASQADIKGEKKGLRGEVEVYPEYQEALEGINGYSHLFIISYLNQLRSDQIGPLKVRPKRLLKRGMALQDLPVLGVFSLDSPTRPNPIGLTLVRLVERQGGRLKVEGLDLFDGTPVLDLKGYRPEYRTEEASFPDWYRELMDRHGHI